MTFEYCFIENTDISNRKLVGLLWGGGLSRERGEESVM